MNQVIFVGTDNVLFHPITDIDGLNETTITDAPNEDFVIDYTTPSGIIRNIEVNRETLNIQKIDSLDTGDGEYYYSLELSNCGDNPAIQLIKQNSVPHQRNSWYIELDNEDAQAAEQSLFTQLKVLSKSNLLGLSVVNSDNSTIISSNPITFKAYDIELTVNANVKKNAKQYIKSLLEKNVQNLGYNHTDDNAELNSGLADYKVWSDTVILENAVIYCLRFATNRKASKTRDERVWQNVYICCESDNDVVTTLDAYIAILNGEGGE